MKEIDVIKVKIDFEKLDNWRSEKDLPVCGFLSLYEALGLTPHIKEYADGQGGVKIAPLNNILCNFYTIQHLRNYIKGNWEIYSLDIDGDNHVFWDESGSYKAWQKHYKKRLKKRIESCLNYDFNNYCPGLDEDLEDDVIVFRIYEEEEEGDMKGDFSDEKALN